MEAAKSELESPPHSTSRRGGWLDDATLGTWLLVSASSMAFLGLGGAFVVLRGAADAERRDAWGRAFAVETAAGRWLMAGCVLLVAGSVLLVVASRRHSRPLVGATWWIGAAFLMTQSMAARSLWRSGDTPQEGIPEASLVLTALVHGLHVVAGLIWLAVVWCRRLRGLGPAALFWHGVGVLWLLLFFGVLR